MGKEASMVLPMQEAKAWCPEGADISEAYDPPVHVPGASWQYDSAVRPPPGNGAVGYGQDSDMRLTAPAQQPTPGMCHTA